MPPLPTLALFLPLSDLIRETSVVRRPRPWSWRQAGGQATAEQIATTACLAITDSINSAAKRRVVVASSSRRPWQVRIFSEEGGNPTARSPSFLPSIERYGGSSLLSSVRLSAPSPHHIKTSFHRVCLSVHPLLWPLSSTPSLECSGEMATEDGGRAGVKRGGTEDMLQFPPSPSRPRRCSAVEMQKSSLFQSIHLLHLLLMAHGFWSDPSAGYHRIAPVI